MCTLSGVQFNSVCIVFGNDHVLCTQFCLKLGFVQHMQCSSYWADKGDCVLPLSMPHLDCRVPSTDVWLCADTELRLAQIFVVCCILD